MPHSPDHADAGRANPAGCSVSAKADRAEQAESPKACAPRASRALGRPLGRSPDNAVYDRVADTWWDQDGFMALLRESVNPARAEYVQRAVARFCESPQGARALDVGCGGGLLSEAWARLGFSVTGVDLSEPSLEAARRHARQAGLSIDHQAADACRLPFPDAIFDAVCCCDVLEHLDDAPRALAEIARVLRPNGLFVFDTINRTWRSKLIAVKVAQEWALTRFMPPDMHVWERFLKPEELRAEMSARGLETLDVAGLSPASIARSAIFILKKKAGLATFEEMGRALPLKISRGLSVAYIGCALKTRLEPASAKPAATSPS